MPKTHFSRVGGQQWVDSFYRPPVETTGNIFYVDSNGGGSTSGPGYSPETAFTTLSSAAAACTANNGDVIYVMEGHAETISGAAGVDLTVAGVRVIGLGHGASRPTFTLTAAASTFAVGASSLHIENLLFVADFTNGVTAGVDIDAAHTDVYFKRCEWRAAASTKEFLKGVTITEGAGRITFDECRFTEVTGGDATAAVFTESTGGLITVKDCTFQGDWSAAVLDLDDDALVPGPQILNNYAYNADISAGLFCTVTAATVGFFVGNSSGIGKANTIPVTNASASVFINNFATDAANLGSLEYPATATAWT